jgi:hypothetical protein
MILKAVRPKEFLEKISKYFYKLGTSYRLVFVLTVYKLKSERVVGARLEVVGR